MIENINIVHTEGPFGDGCYKYAFVTTKEHYTIRELIDASRRDTSEWGDVEVIYGEQEYKLEYSHGQIISNGIVESLYDKEFIEGTAYGGWSFMTYRVSIPVD